MAKTKASKKSKASYKKHLTTFQKDFRKYSGTAIIGAFSLIMALSWNDAIKSYITKLTPFTIAQNALLTAIIITIISVIGIMITSKIITKENSQ